MPPNANPAVWILNRVIVGLEYRGSGAKGECGLCRRHIGPHVDASCFCNVAIHSLRPSSIHTHTHTHTFNGPFSRTTWVSRYQKSKTSLDFTEARDSEWQWHRLGHMQVCTSLQTDNHASTPPLSFLQAGCPSCRPTNSGIALKVHCYVI